MKHDDIRLLKAGIFIGFGLTQFIYFCLYLISRRTFEMTALAIFCAFWLLLMLTDLYSFIHIKRLAVFKNKSELDVYINDNSSFIQKGNYTAWQMKYGDILGEGIFDFDMGASNIDYIR